MSAPQNGLTVDGTLRRCELLDPLSDAQIRALAGNASLRTLGEGESLFRQDEESRQLFIVRTGELSIHLRSPRGEEIGWSMSGPLRLVGWSAFFDPPLYVADAVATTDETSVLVIDAAEAERIMLRDPVAAYAVMKQIAGEIATRMRDLREQFLEVASA